MRKYSHAKYLRQKASGVKKRQDERYRQRHRDKLRADYNERHWRFHIWELAHMDGRTKDLLSRLSHQTKLEITNPYFIVEVNGERRVECLNESLPTW